MTVIPQFESSVPIQPAPVVSSAPIWDSIARTTNALAKVAGTEILRKEQLSLQAGKYEAAAQISTQSQQAYLKASKNPDIEQGMNQFNGAMDGIARGVLSNAHELNAPYIKRMLAYQNNRYNMAFARREAQQSKALGYSKFVNTYDSLSNEMSNAAFNGDQHGALVFHGQLSNMVNDSVKSDLLDPSRAAVFSRNTENQFQEGTTLGQYRAAALSGKGDEFKKQFLTGNKYNSWFDINQKQEMLRRFGAFDKQMAAANGVDLSHYNLTRKQMIFDAQNGRPVDEGVLAQMTTAAPQKAPTLLNDVKNAQDQYQIVSSVKDGTLTDIKHKISQLDNPENVPADVDDAQNNAKASLQLKSYLKDLQNNPVQVIQANPAYQEKLQQINADKSLTPTQLNVLFQNQMGFADNQIHALDNNTSLQAVTAMKSMPLQDQVSAFDDFLDAHAPSSRPYIVKDLQRNGLGLSSQYLYRFSTSTDPILQNMTTPAAIAWNHIQISNGVPNYSKALNDYKTILTAHSLKFSDLETAVTGDSTFADHANMFMSQGGDIASALTNYTKHAELLTAQLIAQGEDITTAAANTNKAMTAGLNFDTYKSNIIGYDSEIEPSLLFGHRFLGKQYSPGVLDYLLDKTKKEGANVPSGFKELFPQLTAGALNKKYLEGATFATLPDQSGLILQDGNNLPVKSKDGNNITVKWSDIKDHNSPFMEAYTKQKSQWNFIKKDLSELNPYNLNITAVLEEKIKTGIL